MPGKCSSCAWRGTLDLPSTGGCWSVDDLTADASLAGSSTHQQHLTLPYLTDAALDHHHCHYLPIPSPNGHLQESVLRYKPKGPCQQFQVEPRAGCLSIRDHTDSGFVLCPPVDFFISTSVASTHKFHSMVHLNLASGKPFSSSPALRSCSRFFPPQVVAPAPVVPSQRPPMPSLSVYPTLVTAVMLSPTCSMMVSAPAEPQRRIRHPGTWSFPPDSRARLSHHPEKQPQTCTTGDVWTIMVRLGVQGQARHQASPRPQVSGSNAPGGRWQSHLTTGKTVPLSCSSSHRTRLGSRPVKNH